MRSLVRAFCAVCAGALAFGVWADVVTVSGTVTDSVSGNPVSGAVVTARPGTGMGGGGTTYRDTTAANGQYSITIPNDTSTTLRVSAMATGYQQNFLGQTVTVANPKDGTADNVTVNIKLRPTNVAPTDTARVIIIATVQDSAAGNAAISGATVSVTSMGTGGTARTATGTTDANGKVVISAAWGANILGAQATISKAGYTSRTTFAMADNDTIDLGTVRLRSVAVGDSVTYRFAGIVTNATTSTGLGNAIVSVVMMSGTTQVYSGLDTTSNSNNQRGTFTLQKRTAYAVGMSVTITVTLTGYVTFDTTFTPASGTNTLNVALVPVSVAVNRPGMAPRFAGHTGSVSVFLMNGRSVRSAAFPAQRTGLVMINRYGQGSALTAGKSVEVR